MANAAHEQKLYIEEVTIHENYNTGKVANHNSLNNGLYDIAVIKLKEAVEWTDWVKPVCLPGTRKLNLTEGASGYIAGNSWTHKFFVQMAKRLERTSGHNEYFSAPSPCSVAA